MLFFIYGANRYSLGLSNEQLFIIIAQEASKLRPFKVKGRKKSYILDVMLILLSKSDSAWLELDQGNSTFLDLQL